MEVNTLAKPEDGLPSSPLLSTNSSHCQMSVLATSVSESVVSSVPLLPSQPSNTPTFNSSTTSPSGNSLASSPTTPASASPPQLVCARKSLPKPTVADQNGPPQPSPPAVATPLTAPTTTDVSTPVPTANLISPLQTPLTQQLHQPQQQQQSQSQSTTQQQLSSQNGSLIPPATGVTPPQQYSSIQNVPHLTPSHHLASSPTHMPPPPAPPQYSVGQNGPVSSPPDLILTSTPISTPVAIPTPKPNDIPRLLDTTNASLPKPTLTPTPLNEVPPFASNGDERVKPEEVVAESPVLTQLNTNVDGAMTASAPTPTPTPAVAGQLPEVTEVKEKRKRKPREKTSRSESEGQHRVSQRARVQYQPFQAPVAVAVPPYYRQSRTAATSNAHPPGDPALVDKIIVYQRGDFLAVRNENNEFFLCRCEQNVYKGSKKFKILWLNNDKDPKVYEKDFYDTTDFECVLTNLRLNRLEKNKYELPEEEKQRTHNILQRALNVEKGINEPPDPIQVAADGVDVSVVGKADEEELLEQILLKRKREVRQSKEKKKTVKEKKGKKRKRARKKPVSETEESEDDDRIDYQSDEEEEEQEDSDDDYDSDEHWSKAKKARKATPKSTRETSTRRAATAKVERVEKESKTRKRKVEKTSGKRAKSNGLANKTIVDYDSEEDAAPKPKRGRKPSTKASRETSTRKTTAATKVSKESKPKKKAKKADKTTSGRKTKSSKSSNGLDSKVLASSSNYTNLIEEIEPLPGTSRVKTSKFVTKVRVKEVVSKDSAKSSLAAASTTASKDAISNNVGGGKSVVATKRAAGRKLASNNLLNVNLKT